MKIHLKSREGMFEVLTYGRNSITLATKHESFRVPVSDFKSFAGGRWNIFVSKEKMDTFLEVVQPEKKIELDTKITALLNVIEKLQAPLIEEEEEDPYHGYSTPTYEDYKSWYESADNQVDELKKKIRNIAYTVYSQNIYFSDIQNDKGIKFIIQTNIDKSQFRFRWDPYGFVSNGHSDISNIFVGDNFYTINGGWIKVIGNNVILYFKSGDYGVYDDITAIECAKNVFPGKDIHSFAGTQWNDELESKFCAMSK